MDKNIMNKTLMGNTLEIMKAERQRIGNITRSNVTAFELAFFKAIFKAAKSLDFTQAAFINRISSHLR